MTDPLDPKPDTPIAELFARNPGDLGESDIRAIIEKLRDSRHRFTQGDKAAGKAKPTKAAVKETAATKITGQLDLGDLGL